MFSLAIDSYTDGPALLVSGAFGVRAGKGAARHSTITMFSLEIDSNTDGRDLLIAELWELGSAGIVELSDTRVRAFFETGADRAGLLARYASAAVREEENRDWVQEARDLLQPMEVGRRFFLVPEWRDDPTPSGRFRITVNPGLALGPGERGA